MNDPAPGTAPIPRLGRRAFLAGLGAGTGLLLARGLGAAALAPSNDPPKSAQEWLRVLGRTLTRRQRELLVLPFDHPARQITNSQSVLERPHLGTLLSPSQRAIVQQLYEAMLSPSGGDALAGTIAVEGRLDGGVLTIFGDPAGDRSQVVLSSGHLMLRGGAGDAGETAFGGGIAYGHQIGNGRWRVEGNSFASHGDAANRLFARLSAEERVRAIVPAPPHELVLQVQDASGAFSGAKVGSLSEAAQTETTRVLETVLSIHPDAERARAFSCIDANGGLAALHVSYFASRGFYEDMASWESLDPRERKRRGDPYWQVWRIEGPGTVVHFKGYPHVHAYVHVVRDPARATVGEALASTPAAIEGERMRRLLEHALRRATGESLAFYDTDVPGRFCPGEVTTGSAWSLDPYRNHVVVATLAAAGMAPALRDRLAASGTAPVPSSLYRVATTDYLATQTGSFGTPERIESGRELLRDALVAELRASGLSSIAS